MLVPGSLSPAISDLTTACTCISHCFPNAYHPVCITMYLDSLCCDSASHLDRSLATNQIDDCGQELGMSVQQQRLAEYLKQRVVQISTNIYRLHRL